MPTIEKALVYDIGAKGDTYIIQDSFVNYGLLTELFVNRLVSGDFAYALLGISLPPAPENPEAVADAIDGAGGKAYIITPGEGVRIDE